jgi:hypothetical protein
MATSPLRAHSTDTKSEAESCNATVKRVAPLPAATPAATAEAAEAVAAEAAALGQAAAVDELRRALGVQQQQIERLVASQQLQPPKQPQLPMSPQSQPPTLPQQQHTQEPQQPQFSASVGLHSAAAPPAATVLSPPPLQRPHAAGTVVDIAPPRAELRQSKAEAVPTGVAYSPTSHAQRTPRTPDTPVAVANSLVRAAQVVYPPF